MKRGLNKSTNLMKEKDSRLLIIISLISVFSYLLNFVWESFHSVFLYNLPDFSLKEYVLLMNHVSSVDALMILGVYLAVALLFKNFMWIKELNYKKIVLFIGFCFLVALVVEYRGIFILNKWSYSSLMPTVFGFGISPLMQLFVTGIIAIYISRNLVD